MRITASCYGDPSVGIPGITIFVEFEDTLLEDIALQGRECLRNRFQLFAGELFDEKANVWFSDECPDCLWRLRNNQCTNKGCISYLPKE